MFAQFKHIIIFVLVVVVLGGVYYASTAIDFFASATSRADSIAKETVDLQQEVRSQLDSIQQIELDSSLFSSKAFTTLEDTSVPLQTPALVRSNPFAALP